MNERGKAIMSHVTEGLSGPMAISKVLEFARELEKRDEDDALKYLDTLTDEQMADLLAYMRWTDRGLKLMMKLIVVTAAQRFALTKDDIKQMAQEGIEKLRGGADLRAVQEVLGNVA